MSWGQPGLNYRIKKNKQGIRHTSYPTYVRANHLPLPVNYGSALTVDVCYGNGAFSNKLPSDAIYLGRFLFSWRMFGGSCHWSLVRNSIYFFSLATQHTVLTDQSSVRKRGNSFSWFRVWLNIHQGSLFGWVQLCQWVTPTGKQQCGAWPLINGEACSPFRSYR